MLLHQSILIPVAVLTNGDMPLSSSSKEKGLVISSDVMTTSEHHLRLFGATSLLVPNTIRALYGTHLLRCCCNDCSFVTCQEPSLQSSWSLTDAHDATACLAVKVDGLL